MTDSDSTVVTAVDRPRDGIDISTLRFWAQPPHRRAETFRLLRDRRPLSWHPPAEGGGLTDAGGGRDDDGFWAVTRHADIAAVSRDPATFSSGQGVIFEDVPTDILEAAQSFLGMDAPRHTHVRRLVAGAFTPRQVARVTARIEHQAERIVDDIADRGECDFVADVAMRLPMWTIADMIGIGESERREVVAAANAMVGWNDPGAADDDTEPAQVLFDSLITLTRHALDLAEQRRSAPADDLMSALVRAEIDGQRLDDAEIAAFFVLLAVAGNDTSRHAISHGMWALSRYPDQRRLLLDDFDARIDGAVQEILRWSTPVMTFRRTATRDVTMHDRVIRRGEKVVLFYTSANRDERVFDTPDAFDITREPNNHLSFGGGGPHFCLGRTLANTQIRAILDRLLHRLPDLVVDEPTHLVSNFMNGIVRMPCRFTPERKAS